MTTEQAVEIIALLKAIKFTLQLILFAIGGIIGMMLGKMTGSGK